MNNFINVDDYDATIHREILDSLLREEAGSSATVEVCENRAIATVRSLIGNRYDCDAIFSQTADARHPLILMMAIDIAVYHIFCTTRTRCRRSARTATTGPSNG